MFLKKILHIVDIENYNFTIYNYGKFLLWRYCRTGTHLTLEDAVHYFNIFNGDIKLSDLSEIEKRLINITKNEESVEPSKENLNELYAMISGQKEPVLCNDDPIECCKNKVNIRTYGWDDKEFKPSVNGVSVKGFYQMVCFALIWKM